MIQCSVMFINLRWWETSKPTEHVNKLYKLGCFPLLPVILASKNIQTLYTFLKLSQIGELNQKIKKLSNWKMINIHIEITWEIRSHDPHTVWNIRKSNVKIRFRSGF